MRFSKDGEHAVLAPGERLDSAVLNLLGYSAVERGGAEAPPLVLPVPRLNELAYVALAKSLAGETMDARYVARQRVTELDRVPMKQRDAAYWAALAVAERDLLDRHVAGPHEHAVRSQEPGLYSANVALSHLLLEATNPVSGGIGVDQVVSARGSAGPLFPRRSDQKAARLGGQLTAVHQFA
jgi:hypothetical protein